MNTAKTIRIPAYGGVAGKVAAGDGEAARQLGGPDSGEIAVALDLPRKTQHHQESHPHLQLRSQTDQTSPVVFG